MYPHSPIRRWCTIYVSPLLREFSQDSRLRIHSQLSKLEDAVRDHMWMRCSVILMFSFLTSCFTGSLKSRGTLVADIGMTFDEVIRQSTLRLKPPYRMR